MYLVCKSRKAKYLDLIVRLPLFKLLITESESCVLIFFILENKVLIRESFRLLAQLCIKTKPSLYE